MTSDVVSNYSIYFAGIRQVLVSLSNERYMCTLYVVLEELIGRSGSTSCTLSYSLSNLYQLMFFQTFCCKNTE